VQRNTRVGFSRSSGDPANIDHPLLRLRYSFCHILNVGPRHQPDSLPFALAGPTL
jgi:hypothetical protein